MKPFLELSGREKRIELLRWIAVLPAAALGGLVASIVAEVVAELASSGRMLHILITETLMGVSIVMAGGHAAPRCRVLTSVVLAALWILLSLIMHVLLRGTLGWTNYLAVTVASVAVAASVAFICIQKCRSGSKVH